MFKSPRQRLLDRRLFEAAKDGNTEAAMRCLESGADLAALDIAGKCPWFHAVSKGHRDCAMALSRGSPVNGLDDRGLSAVARAAASGREDRLALALECGAKPDGIENPGEHTPLMRALMLGSFGCAKMLLEAGANPRARDSSGLEPIVCAAMGSLSGGESLAKSQVFDLLIAAGGVEAMDGNGRTALMHCISTGSDARTLAQLVAAADLRARVEDGLTIVEWARREGSYFQAELFENLARPYMERADLLVEIAEDARRPKNKSPSL
jgi:ankyrin repeat protein